MIIDKQTIEFNLSFHFSRSNFIANSIFFLQTDFNEQATANMHNEILRWTVSQVTSPKRSWINLINGRGNGWPFVVISSNLTKLGNKQFHTRVVLVWNSRINPRQANVNFLSWNIFLSSPFVWMTNSKKNSIDSIKKSYSILWNRQFLWNIY